MTNLFNLSTTDIVSGAYQIPVLDPQSGAVLRLSVSQLQSFSQDGLTTPGYLQTQYASPTGSGFSVDLVPLTPGGSMYLLLTPLAGYAAGSIVLPSPANVQDGQEVLCNTTQAVTALTISGNGASVVGAPTTLAANGFFRLRYNSIPNTWYRVG